MELLVSLFLGVWIAVFGLISYFNVKKEYTDAEKKNNEEDNNR